MVIDKIIGHINQLLKTHTKILAGKLKYMYLVGGFSTSMYVQRRIREAFGETYQVRIPIAPMLSVVTGAAFLGRPEITASDVPRPSTFVTQRVMARTYGVSCARELRYVENDSRFSKEHLQHYQQTDGKKTWITQCFDEFIKKGETIDVHQEITKSYLATTRIVMTTVFVSNDINPATVTDCTKLGTIVTQLPDSVKLGEDYITTKFYFGYTTIRVCDLVNDVVLQQTEIQYNV
ncbi:hypothetical protein RFI_12647 [Reticulomyxa filosa]|uniref:Uncharacterized protein n=1 Tax=Reticulomyxa filosa TaxID=46433 RepID=X6NFJ1_RETFI|nr:hypothetical protein RFI_12647 [Reticulomyxa filosa]|eukprot:ETO24509.1 hypothetical protein RFI_12647 [Reticulomyxa filosa]